MKLKLSFLIIATVCLISEILGQNIPAGVGNSDNVVLWLDASQLSLGNGDKVTSWSDLSSYSNDATQATVANQPIYVASDANFNSKPTVSFGRSNSQYLIIPDASSLDGGSSGTDEISVICVARASTLYFNTYHGLVSKRVGNGDNDSYNLYFRDYWNEYIFFDVNSSGSAYDRASKTNEYIFSATYDASLSQDNIVICNNSDDQVSEDYNENIPNNSSDLYIGSMDASSDFLDGNIAEVLIYSKALNDAERIVIENYLNEKYDVEIGSNDFFSNSNSYIDNIIGVGTSDGVQKHEASSISSAGVYLEATGNSLDASNEFAFISNKSSDVNSDGNISDIPAGVNSRWSKDWYLDVTGNVSAKLSFDFGESLATTPANENYYVLLYRSGTSGDYSIVNDVFPKSEEGDRISLFIPASSIQDGYYTIGKLTTLPTYETLYGFYSSNADHDWDDAITWSTKSDAYENTSGVTPDDDTNYRVVILDGRSIDIPTNGKTNKYLEIKAGGTLNLGTTSGHSFNQIAGSGIINIETNNFPSYVDASGFTDATGGTVDYSGSFDITLSSYQKFNNLRVFVDNSNTVTLNADLDLNGYLEVHMGTLQIGDGSTQIDMNVDNNFEIEATGNLTIGNGNHIHTLTVKEDVNINGTADFTNQNTYDYENEPTTGAIDLIFNNTIADQVLNCSNTAKFYRIRIEKGTIERVLTISADDPSYFKLYGKNNHYVGPDGPNEKALALNSGTVKLSTNIEIPNLSSFYSMWSWFFYQDYGTPYYIKENAQLWLDGASVTYDADAADEKEAAYIAVYGKLKLTNTNSVLNVIGDEIIGTVIRNSGAIDIQDGTFTTVSLRASYVGGVASNIGSYSQSGGTVNIIGIPYPEGNDQLFKFHLPFKTNTFIMSGGTLNIDHPREGSDVGTDGGILINCDEGNYTVTGGTVNCTLNTSQNFRINTTAPFYNLNLEKTTSGAYSFIINDYAGAGDLPALSAQTLKILNNFSITESGNNTIFNANGSDLEIGRQFIIEEEATYTSGNNTTRFFSGSASRVAGDETDRSRLVIENTTDVAPVEFYNLFINHDDDGFSDATTLIVQSDGRNTTEGDNDNFVLTINNDLTVSSSNIFRYDGFSINVKGNIVTDGRFGNSSNITRLNGTSNQSITNSNVGGIRQTIEIDNASGVSLMNSDEFDLKMTNGIFDIGTYEFSTDGPIEVADGSEGNIDDFDNTLMILTAGLGSDGGYKRRFMDGTAAGTYLYPVGTYNGSSNIYTPVEVTLTGTGQINNDENYFSVVSVDTYHPGTKSGSENKVLHYYWKTKPSGFESITDLSVSDIQFYGDASIENSGSNLDAQLFYNMAWENNSNNVYDKTNIILTFADNGTGSLGFDQADFTAGNASAFNALTVLYSRNATSGGDWETEATWSDTGHDGDPATGSHKIPDDNVFVVIAEDHTVTINSNSMVSLDITLQGTLDVGTTALHNFGTISGNGTFKISGNSLPTANFQPFTEINSSTFEYYGDAGSVSAYTLPSSISKYYDLTISGSAVKTLPAVDFDIRRRLLISSTATEVYVNNGAGGDFEVTKNLRIYRNSQLIFQNSGTARNVICNSKIRLLGDGSEIKVQDAGAVSLQHSITLYGDLDIGHANANCNFYSTASGNTNVIDLTVTGSDAVDLGASGYSVGELNRLIINKGSDNSTNVNLYNAELKGETSGAGVDKALELQNGSLTIINDLSAYSSIPIVLNSGNENFIIPATTSLIINEGTATVTGANTGISLAGKLRIENNGKLYLDDGSNNNYIEYGTNATLELADDADVIVGSQIRRQTSVTTGDLQYTQTGGTLVVGKNSVLETSRGVFEILNNGTFNFSAGEISIAKGHSGTIADLYLYPASSTCNGTINIGVDGGSVVTIFVNSNIALGDFNVKGRTIAKLSNSLILNKDFKIFAGNQFNANNFNLSIAGDYANLGTYTPGTNTTTFDGTEQDFVGETTFNNLDVSSSTSFMLDNSSDITVTNNFSNSADLTNGGSNIDVAGDITNTGIIDGDGIVKANGTSLQTVSGGTFNNFEVDNISTDGVVSSGDIVITGILIITNGIFNIATNELYLENNPVISGTSFSSTKMLTTSGDVSNKGLKIAIPAVATSYNIPIGAGSKFSEFTIDINTASTSGDITIVPVNSPHPTALDDNKVLQFYWNLAATGLTGLDCDLVFNYSAGDVNGTEADYVSAHLVNTDWYKYLTINTTDHTAGFYNVSDVNGDFTAGEDPDGIPDKVPEYISNGTGGGNWTSVNSWIQVDDAPALVEGIGPSGVVLTIQSADIINMNTDNIINYKTTINGVLYIDGTIAHNIGYIEGNGKMQVLDVGTLPSGNLNVFTASSGGTLEFSDDGDGTDDDYSISGTYTNFNNLIISGTGNRSIPTGPITVLNNFYIKGTVTLDNSVNDSRIVIDGDIDFENGASFNAGTNEAVVEFVGDAVQNVGGTGSFTGANAFYKFEINNSTGVNINTAVDVDNEIIFTNGLIENTDNFALTLSNGATYSNISNTSFVNGSVKRYIIINGSGSFPTGKINQYKEIGISNTGVATTWTAEYLGSNTLGSDVDPGDAEGLNKVSVADMWFLGTGVVSNSGNVTLNWNGNSGVENISSMRIAEWESGNSYWSNKGGTGSGTGESGSIVATGITFSDMYFSLASASAENPLPIELLSFKANCVENAVNIDWITLSEINNDYFTIEKSDDAVNFMPIQNVDGAGNSNEKIDYKIIDNNPYEGINYYRLTQTDFNGIEKYYSIISVNYNLLQNLGESKISVSPNPVYNGDVSIMIGGFNPKENIFVGLYDITGNIVWKKIMKPISSEISHSLNPIIKNLNKGLFFLIASDEEKIESVKIIKL